MNKQLFVEYEKDKSVKIGVCPLVGRLSPRDTSHKAAWAFMLANQIKNEGYDNVEVISGRNESWNDYDVILIEHGMEFKGTFNIFGGANDDLYHQINRIFDGARMYSYGVDMPSIKTLIEKRYKTGSDLFKTLDSRKDEIDQICQDIPRIDLINRTDKMCFGDSHSFSQYEPGYMVSRNDGLTLYGATKRDEDTPGFERWVDSPVSVLRTYLGNIDIRHHLMRRDDPMASAEELISRYEKELLYLQGNGIAKEIEVVHVLPIEDESRKLPKTGYYDGTPFYGSWQERTDLSLKLNQLIDQMCERNGWRSMPHADQFFDDEGKLPFDVMEKPKSVHIARRYYRWDFEQNKPNELLTYSK